MRWLNLTSLACVVLMAISVYAAPPATQPAPPAVARSCDVLILPFAVLGDQNVPPWVVTAVQKNMAADLARAHFAPATLNKSPPDAIEAQNAGQSAGARYVIFGNTQSIDDMLRFDGQIMDVQSGTVIGGVSETGAARDLFSLEDSLSNQAVGMLRREAAAAAEAANPPAPPPAPPAVAVAPPPARPYVRPYEGSDLESYINANITPSNDYPAPYRTALNRQMYWPGYTNGYWPYYGYGYGYGFGYGYGYYRPWWGYYSYSGSYYGNGYGASYYGYGTPVVSVRLTPQAPIYFSTDRTSH
jgi:TolB-like protein